MHLIDLTKVQKSLFYSLLVLIIVPFDDRNRFKTRNQLLLWNYLILKQKKKSD